jgi:hypothetical protein
MDALLLAADYDDFPDDGNVSELFTLVSITSAMHTVHSDLVLRGHKMAVYNTFEQTYHRNIPGMLCWLTSSDMASCV